MSASEKLKELDEAITPSIQWHPGLGAEIAAIAAVRHALPQIVAVIEAAEDGRDHSLLLQSSPAGVEMLGWSVERAQRLQAALVALDEALS